MVIGGAVSTYFTVRHKDKQIQHLREQRDKELKLERQASEEKVYILAKRILQLEDLAKQDSIAIVNLEEQIRQDGVRFEQRRRDINRLTPNEKKDWILNRYNYKPKPIQPG